MFLDENSVQTQHTKSVSPKRFWMRHLQIYGIATVKTLWRVSVMSGLQNYFKVKENNRKCFLSCFWRFLHFNYLFQLALWLFLCIKTSSNNLKMVFCFQNCSTDRGKKMRSDLIPTLEQLEFKLEKRYWDLETCRKSWKSILTFHCSKKLFQWSQKVFLGH